MSAGLLLSPPHAARDWIAPQQAGRTPVLRAARVDSTAQSSHLQLLAMSTTAATSRAWNVSTHDFPRDGDAAEILTFLLRYAVLAPSGHNTQPWLFRVRRDAVDLYANRAVALPVVDPDDRELTLSCGAALLNLRLALRRFGYSDEAYELTPDAAEEDLLARVRLVAGAPPSLTEAAIFDAIPQRRTTRSAYEGRRVPSDVEHELMEAAAQEGAWLHLVGEGERGAVADLIAEGDKAQMHDKRFRRELAAWIHPNRSRSGDGMRGYSFGFGDLMSLAGPLVIRTFDTGNGQAAKDRELIAHTPLLCVLGTDSDSPRAWLSAGQAMERALLNACARGLRSSFLNQPVEMESIRGRLAEAIGRHGTRPQLVMRFGYGPEITHAPRKALEECLIQPDTLAGRIAATTAWRQRPSG